MNNASRRGFLAITGAGAAAVATAAAAHASGSTADAAPSGEMVAHVRNAKTGEVAIMMGEREVVVKDKALAASMAKHLR